MHLSIKPRDLLLLSFPFQYATARFAHARRDLSSFIDSEKAVALEGILANIGPDGMLDHGAKSGVVIASPSTVNPNYLYTWTRDSALTLKTLIDEFTNGDDSLQSHIEDYISALAYLQTITNPSGSLSTGAGLGEPKYNIDLTRFNGAWGRPQRDGPALRSIALMTYAKWLAANNQENRATTVVWPVIINDLNYVAQYWNQTGFDLWEEGKIPLPPELLISNTTSVNGSSFFTIQNQHRALVEGSQVAATLGQECPNCDSQAPEILCFLQSFWNGEYITSNINVNNGRSGKDAASILGPIAVFDIDAACDFANFQPCNTRSLANFKVLIDSFRDIYTINNDISKGEPVAIGRYPEDIYYGGNPWYLCTLAAAEFLYDAAAQFKTQQTLTVDEVNQAFFKDIYPSIQIQSYQSSDSSFNDILSSMTTYADGFVSLVQKYLPANNSISEQYSRENGTALSAFDLTWSFASFVTMSERRAGYYPASWNTSAAAPAPSTCQGTSAQGTYVPAIAAGAPNGTQSCTVNVLFRVNATTYFGENVYITGNDSTLGDWDVSNADPLNPGNYTSDRPLWYLYLDLPAGSTVSYSYVRQESDGSYLYEMGNRTLAVPACGDASVTEEDAWLGPTGTPSSR